MDTPLVVDVEIDMQVVILKECWSDNKDNHGRASKRGRDGSDTLDSRDGVPSEGACVAESRGDRAGEQFSGTLNDQAGSSRGDYHNRASAGGPMLVMERNIEQVVVEVESVKCLWNTRLNTRRTWRSQ